MRDYRERQPLGQIAIGVSLAILGVLFTLNNLHILRARDYLQYWPVGLVAVGLAQLVQARTTGRVWSGAILTLVGVSMLVERLGIWDVNVWALWPLVLVVVGGRIFWRAFQPGRSLPPFPPSGPIISGSATATSGSTVSGSALMGGFDRKVVSQAFERAELTAFMGGGKLDLREATLANGRGVVDVFALMGGFEIRVPTTWDVDIEVTPFMGNCDDKTLRHADGTAPRLTVRGFVMMGGVDIRN